MTNKTIEPTQENEHIIAEMLKIEIKRAMDKKRTFADDLIRGLR